ncbi:hypothetical protein OG429_17115 [Streptomyces sp. NBC_00190]|uniref:hypothetical protein n=1 Tax=Streptomyces sp. NBC_00190 TaxID=2903634 RepID=UPI002E2C894D|nr:hypothetical protein [Streptomyces sp. NBC_00190]
MLTTVRVHDYRGDPFPLLTGGVLPLVADFAADTAVPVCFPTRHWDGGPHLALHLGYGSPSAAALATVRERLAAAAGTGDAWSAGEYRRRVRSLAASEGTEVRHALPYPHAAVAVSTDPVAPGPVEAARHRFLTELALLLPEGLTEDAATARSRAPGLALQWMAAVAAAYPGGARFGSLSFHSHAEAFLASRPDGEELRVRFTTAAERHRPQTDRLVDIALHRPEQLPGHAACVAACRQLSDPALRPDLDVLVAGGRAPDTGSAPSAFHRQLAEGGFGQNAPAAFTAFRAVVNWLYEALQWLGVTPLNRYLYCHSLANAIDVRLGEPWQDRLKVRPA